jgi:hypothetical protein
VSDEEIIQKVMDGTWWPFDRIDPRIVQEIERRDKQKQFDEMEEAPL